MGAVMNAAEGGRRAGTGGRAFQGAFQMVAHLAHLIPKAKPRTMRWRDFRVTETKLPEGLEWVLGRINATRFINQGGGKGMTNEAKLLDTLEALLKDGVNWADLEIAMRQRAESVLGIEPSKECSGCGDTDDRVWCEDCFAQRGCHCASCGLGPVCRSCGGNVAHPLCERCLN